MLLSAAFAKWKALCIRHVEELSLMESYQDVKREGKSSEHDRQRYLIIFSSLFLELVKRMFVRWLNSARKARHRRLVLQQKEEEMKLAVIASAWD